MQVTPQPDCWLSDQVEVRPSRIAGLGLVATGEIAGGTVVSRLGGHLVSDAALREMLRAPRDAYIDTVSIFEDGNLVLPVGTANHYGNHSCEPNLWWVEPFSLATRTRIAAGTELTVDYGTLTDDPDYWMECACRTATCRRIITGVDWTRPDLQDRYGDHWVPVLRRKMWAARLAE